MRDAHQFPHGRTQWITWAIMALVGVALIVAIYSLYGAV